jgi:hypothetical protein
MAVTVGGRGMVVAALLALAALVGLGACGGSDAPAPSSAPSTSKPDEGVDPAVAEATKRTTAAMAVGEGTAPVELRFGLAAEPVAGRPTAVELAVLPKVTVPTLRVAVRGDGDVEVAEPAQVVTLEKVQSGTLHTVPVSAIPQRAGATTLTVAVTLVQPTGEESRTFQLPLLVRAADGAAAASPTAPATPSG